MIDPRVAIEDVNPELFTRLNAAVSRRQSEQPSTATLVVDGPDRLEALGDLEEVRRGRGVEQLVVLDRSRLDDLSAQFVEAARQTDDQGELLIRCREIYVNHPAVTLVPCPSDSASAWAPVERLLQSVENGRWITVAVGEWELAAEVHGGRIVRITSTPPSGAVSAVSLKGSVDDLEAVLSAPSPIGELLDRVEAGLVAVDVGEGVQWVA